MSEDIDRHFGQRLRRRRRILGLTQTALGAACGVCCQQIQKYESGLNRMSAARLWTFSEILGVQISYFYDGLLRPEPVGPPPDA